MQVKVSSDPRAHDRWAERGEMRDIEADRREQMQGTSTATVRAIAFLDGFCRERGVPSTLSVEVPEGGISASDLAESIGLPLDRIEGVFHNHRGAGLDAVIIPGDRVAFVPFGTPASHPAFFGRFVTRR
jgi:hypothetical protein